MRSGDTADNGEGGHFPFLTLLSPNPFFFNLFTYALSLTPTLPTVLCLLQLFTQLELQVYRNRLEAKPAGFPGRTRTRTLNPETHICLHI